MYLWKIEDLTHCFLQWKSPESTYHLCDLNLSCAKWRNKQISLMPYILVWPICLPKSWALVSLCHRLFSTVNISLLLHSTTSLGECGLTCHYLKHVKPATFFRAVTHVMSDMAVASLGISQLELSSVTCTLADGVTQKLFHKIQVRGPFRWIYKVLWPAKYYNYYENWLICFEVKTFPVKLSTLDDTK